MLKILWKRGEIAPEEQFLLLSIIFCYLMLEYYVKTGIRFSFEDKRLFEITGVEITRVDCILKMSSTGLLWSTQVTSHFSKQCRVTVMSNITETQLHLNSSNVLLF